LNIDEQLIEDAITDRTRAICPVHYAGVAADMDAICAIADRHALAVVEDAAQGILASYKGRPLGTIGDLGTLSFHETKNVICGEGGALLCRDKTLVERAEILREKGTDRSRFFRGEIDKYTWVDIGSSYLPPEITAAFLSAQLDQAASITARRLAIWNRYFEGTANLEQKGCLRRPIVPDWAHHNAHMFYVLLPTGQQRDIFIQKMSEYGVHTVFHYVPLHSSPAGLSFGRASSEMTVTDDISQRLVRLPLWLGMEDLVDYVVDSVTTVLTELQ
jgi:dTDP-4-amino-4,6-dideoxygalactose transaminase